MNLDQVKRIIHNRALDMRACHRHVDGEMFESAWAKATEMQRMAATFLLEEGAILAVERWTRNILGVRSLRELRERARGLGVQLWYTMDKDTLIEEVKKREGQSRGPSTGDEGGAGEVGFEGCFEGS